MKQKWNAAFTLLELMIVVAIIAVLLSLLLPALSKAQDAARKAVCASNLHQIGAAYASYAGDFEGRYPPALDNQPWPFGTCANAIATNVWVSPAMQDLLVSEHRITDVNILFCPSADPSGSYFTYAIFGQFWQFPQVYDFLYSGYACYGGYAMTLNDGADNTPMPLGLTPLKITDLGGLVLGTDMMVNNPGYPNGWNNHWNGIPKIAADGTTVYFTGGNILYNDGSVHWSMDARKQFTRAGLGIYF